MNSTALILIGLAAVAGGAVNALAGGGTLITFPMLTAVGVPAVAANITNTIALCPGYLGATYAQRSDLQGQLLRLCALLPIGVAGGLTGGVLLLHSGEQLFRSLVPHLILFAVALLAFQDPMRTWIMGRTGRVPSSLASRGLKALPVAPAAVYGGYFGAGASVIILAVLGLVMDDTLKRLNALKQAVALSMNIAAAVFLVFSGQVVWPAVLVMAAGAVAGGVIGGRLAKRVPVVMLRRIIVTIGVIVALIYLVNQ